MKRFGTLVILVLARGLAFGQNPPHSPADHFLCLKAKDASSPAFAGATTTLADQFESGSFNVVKDKGLCAPAAKNGVAVVDPNTHLVSYTVKASGTVTPSAVPRTGIKV